jgi:hypothetical protein
LARSSKVIRVAVFGAIVFSTGAASGQRKSEAERNFELGRQATSLGQYSTACSLFKESYRLEPAVGTLINLGDCEEHLGHPSLARDYYEHAFSSLSVTDDRLTLVKDRIAAIEKTAPRLQLRLGDGAPSGTKIKVDGDVLDDAKLATPILLAPGNHVVVVTAVGYRGSRQGVSLKEGEARALTVWPGPALEAAVPTFVEVPPSATPEAREQRSRTLRTIGFVAGGLGLASLWVGSVSGLFAIDRESTRSENCSAGNVCNRAGYDAAQSGKQLATVSTITLTAGLIATGAGLYLVLANPGTSQQTTLAPVALPGGASFTLRRSF